MLGPWGSYQGSLSPLYKDYPNDLSDLNSVKKVLHLSLCNDQITNNKTKKVHKLVHKH